MTDHNASRRDADTLDDARQIGDQLSQAEAMAERLVEERTADLRRMLEQKTLLLYEIDHRVKNNLQLIASLIMLQSRRIQDPDARIILNAMLERVTALATVHRTLFQADDVSVFDVAAFLQTLANDMVGSSGREDLVLDLDLQPVVVEPARAAPIALVVNEVLTNALRHAFPDRGGRVRVATRPAGDSFLIEIEDDGVGCGPVSGPVGFGQSLVDLLSRQLSAEIVRTDAAPGVKVSIAVPFGAFAPSAPPA